jgi:hypothetical protein
LPAVDFRRIPPISPPVFRTCVGRRKGWLFCAFSGIM